MTDSPDFPGRGIVWLGPAASYTRGRPDGPPMLGVLHCTANTATPTQEAQYAARSNPASAHFYAGDASPAIVQSVRLADYAWHAGGAFGNRRGVGLEVCGLPSWTDTAWTADMRDVNAAAKVIRLVGAKTGIRRRWLDRTQLRALIAAPSVARSGWVTHAQYNAWSPDAGSDHTDPGPEFPLELVMSIANSTEDDDMDWTDDIAPGATSYSAGGAIWTTLDRTGTLTNVQIPAINAQLTKLASSVAAATAADATRDAALMAALREIQTGGTSLDTAAVLAAVTQQGEITRAAVLDRLAAAGDALDG
jgi:hypothetical protein